MSDVTGRLLTLLTLLQTGRRWGGTELAGRLGVSVRSVRRDVDRLRGYGYRIDAQPGPDGFYRLAPGEQLPPLVLDDAEAVAVLAALTMLAATGDEPGSLGDVAGGVQARIEQVLPLRLRRQAEAGRRAMHASPVNAPPTRATTVGQVARAIADRRVLRFRYQRRDETTDRVVEPHHLVNRHLSWYLIGWDQARVDWRTYRVDRIHHPELQPDTFAPRALPTRSVDDYLDQGFLRERTRVVLTVHAAQADVAAALAYQDAHLTALDPTKTRVELHLDDWRWLLLNLAFLDANFTIDEPHEFAAGITTFADRLTRSTRQQRRTAVGP